VLALLTTAIAVPAAPAAAENPMEVVNSASFEIPNVAENSRLTIFTGPRVTDLEGVQPWLEVLSDGLFVEATCTNGVGRRKVPISWIGPSGSGTQINLYMPGGWSCVPAGSVQFIVHGGGKYGNVTIERGVGIVPAHPGVFATTGAVPSGFWASVVSGTTAPLYDCVINLPANPDFCPVSIDGVRSRVQLTLTGADYFVDHPSLISFELAPSANGQVVGAWTAQPLVDISRAGMGVENVTFALGPEIVAREYHLRVRNSVYSQSVQELVVEFGPPA
jgi:hypothetical protein